VSVELAAQPDVENEVVSLRVESVMNHGFWLLASRSQSASDLDPWKSRIQVFRFFIESHFFELDFD
jgi:hypothetical protein